MIQHFTYMGGMYTLEMRAKLLDFLLKSGVDVERGMVVKGKELFKFETFRNREEGALQFIDKAFYEDILNVTDRYMGIHLLKDLEAFLMSLNGPETVEFLYRVTRKGNVPATRNFAKSLVFVIGNLDEAYKMSDNMNPDMEADEFHNESLKINAMICRL